MILLQIFLLSFAAAFTEELYNHLTEVEAACRRKISKG